MMTMTTASPVMTSTLVKAVTGKRGGAGKIKVPNRRVGSRVGAIATDAPPGTTNVDIDVLKKTTNDALRAIGYSESDAAVILDVLLYAQLRGNNQGIIKITTNGLAVADDAKPMEITHETKLSAAIDGKKQQGMLVLAEATRIAKEKAKEHGFGICGTCNTSTSTGALGYYCKTVADEGMIAICLAQSPEFVAPAGSSKAIFGTNPIGIGIPSSEGSTVLDMATSAYSWFGVLEARTAGKQLPEGAAQDKDGVPTTDPNAVIDGGAIRTFDGGYKSSNLALMVELLAGPLVGAAIQDKLTTKNWGNLIMVLDPKMLGQADFEANAAHVINRVRNAPKQPGVEQITIPGERGDAIAAAVIAKGSIAVESNLWNDLQKVAAEWKGN
jgi:LDH2 family malate/lactate/ureidoglycolate dehydrogenase